jgi:hypothetical protein
MPSESSQKLEVVPVEVRERFPFRGLQLHPVPFAGSFVCEAPAPAFEKPRLPEDGCDIGTIQELLGHSDERTTLIYTHILNRGGRGVLSSLDRR